MNQLTCRGKLALIRQFDLNDVCSLDLEDGDRLVEYSRDFGIEIVDIKGGGHADAQPFNRISASRPCNPEPAR